MNIANNLFFVIIVAITIVTSCRSRNNVIISDKGEIVLALEGAPSDMLMGFYTSYIQLSESKSDLGKIDSIKNIYLTKELRQNMSNDNLGYDPIVNAQDSDIAWLNSLGVKKNSDNSYDVSYITNDGNKKITVRVSVIVDDGAYKIDKFVNIPTTENSSIESSSIIQSISGTWKINCESSLSSIRIYESNIFVTLNSNQIYIDANYIVNHGHSLDIFLSGPHDLGSGGMNLNWNGFQKDSLIGKININPGKVLTFNWLGFYDEDIQRRVWIENTEFELDYKTVNESIAGYDEESDYYYILKKCN